jgi:hypothetical protein
LLIESALACRSWPVFVASALGEEAANRVVEFVAIMAIVTVAESQVILGSACFALSDLC